MPSKVPASGRGSKASAASTKASKEKPSTDGGSQRNSQGSKRKGLDALAELASPALTRRGAKDRKVEPTFSQGLSTPSRAKPPSSRSTPSRVHNAASPSARAPGRPRKQPTPVAAASPARSGRKGGRGRPAELDEEEEEEEETASQKAKRAAKGKGRAKDQGGDAAASKQPGSVGRPTTRLADGAISYTPGQNRVPGEESIPLQYVSDPSGEDPEDTTDLSTSSDDDGEGDVGEWDEDGEGAAGGGGGGGGSGSEVEDEADNPPSGKHITIKVWAPLSWSEPQPLKVHTNQTVASFKEGMSAKTKGQLLPEQMVLTFSHVKLEDRTRRGDRTLASYGITKEGANVMLRWLSAAEVSELQEKRDAEYEAREEREAAREARRADKASKKRRRGKGNRSSFQDRRTPVKRDKKDNRLRWNNEQVEQLVYAVESGKGKNWADLAESLFPGERTGSDVRDKWRNILKAQKRGGVGQRGEEISRELLDRAARADEVAEAVEAGERERRHRALEKGRVPHGPSTSAAAEAGGEGEEDEEEEEEEG